MFKNINISEDDRGAVVQISSDIIYVEYEFESLSEAIESLSSLPELQPYL